MKNSFPNLKLILLHGGDVRLAEFAQFTRHFDDVYIDLSYTLTKYNSDYIDSQILFCFNELDEKCLIGSDFPYVSLNLFRKRVDLLTKNISDDKKCNIYYKNAEKNIWLMNHKERSLIEKLNKKYTENFKKHGFSKSSVGWSSDKTDERYKLLFRGLDNYNTILDIGCGLGHLLLYLKQNKFDIKYSGSEINPTFIIIKKL